MLSVICRIVVACTILVAAVAVAEPPKKASPTTAPATEKPAAKHNAKRFVDRGEYVEDTETGLLWQKDGAASGKKNYNEALKYAADLKLGRLTGWRVPTAEECKAIFPADGAPFVNTRYNPKPYSSKERGVWVSYWTVDLDTRRPDYAYVYQWYADGGANNCTASKNFVSVRCVHDPLKAKK